MPQEKAKLRSARNPSRGAGTCARLWRLSGQRLGNRLGNRQQPAVRIARANELEADRHAVGPAVPGQGHTGRVQPGPHAVEHGVTGGLQALS